MPIWGVNALAEFFLELTIKFRTDLENSIALTVSERTRMRSLLEELPAVRQVHDSGGNFLLVELTGEDPGVASRLRRDLLASSRIEVKDISGKYPDRRPRLRLAVRTQDDNDRLLNALRALATEAES
jgi:histidinol-phosphate/aromatic aminotransferase/cobyric acid decarboxylase-like protein